MSESVRAARRSLRGSQTLVGRPMLGTGPGTVLPPNPPDPTLPLPWMRGTSTSSDPVAAPLWIKGLIPWSEQGATMGAGPWDPSGDTSYQSRYRVNSSTVTTSNPYGDSSVNTINRVSVFCTAEVDAGGQIYKGFACCRADSGSANSITFLTDMTEMNGGSSTKNHVYSTQAVTNTAPAVTLTVTTPSGGASTISCTVGGTLPSGTNTIVIMPERVLKPGASPTFTTYLNEGRLQNITSTGVHTPSVPSAGFATGKIYYAFVANGDPTSATVVSTIVSKPVKFTVT